MSSAEGSPARTSATPEREQDLPVNDPASGPNTSGSFASYDPDSQSWKTCQRSLIEEWAEFSETWPRSGMTRSGTAYQLPQLAHRMTVTGFGSLLTPIASDEDLAYSLRDGYERKDGHSFGSLSEQLISRYGCRNSPLFAEMLMGFPPGWTDVYMPLVMPSSRKSRKSSEGQS
jgi:hypothetical protein